MLLSERQQRILTFIRQYLEEHHYPPSIREICKATGISSTSVVKYNLEQLHKKGYIERSNDVSRGLSLKGGPSLVPADVYEATPAIVEIPKWGIISAGTPISVAGQQDNPFAGETLALTRDLVADGGQLYALQVKGDSMIDALVSDGDWVIIRYQPTAERGDMIVAWLKEREETTLKYYYPEGQQVRLQPANPAYQPIYVPGDQLEIQGKVVAVVRQLS